MIVFLLMLFLFVMRIDMYVSYCKLKETGNFNYFPIKFAFTVYNRPFA